MSLPDEPFLYLIGVNHAMQFTYPLTQMFPRGESEAVRKKRADFTAHISEMIDKLDIDILAEEWSDEEFSDKGKLKSEAREFLKAFGETTQQFNWENEFAQLRWETVPQQLGKAKGVDHRFCDPTSSEKQALGIEVDAKKETKSDWDKRERFWLSKIADCKQRRVLFVCGDNHYDAFAELLETNGFNVRRGKRYDISDEEFHDL